MAKQDYYEILGVSKTAEEREIKKAFLQTHVEQTVAENALDAVLRAQRISL